MFAASKSGSADAKDPQFNYVTMLLHGNGTNGAQNNTFVDSSTNNFTITRNGNTTQGTFTPYGSNWSNYFDGTSGQYLNAPANTAFNFGTGDFTIEGWVYPTSTSGTRPIVEIRTLAINSTGFAFLSQSGATTLNVYTNGGFVGASTNSLTTNQWNHVALVRSGNTWTYWINGVSSGSFTNSSNQIDGAVTGPKIGGSTTTGEIWVGYMSNIRIVKGTAVYTTSFTPSTTPLTAISGTSLLTCQSNRFIDNSTNAFAITVNGSPKVQRFSPFSPTTAYSTSVIGGSGYFDGSGDYLDAGAQTAFAFGTGSWTVEAWVYVTTLQEILVFDTRSSASTAGIGCRIDANGTLYYSGSANNSLTSTAITANSWNHVAWVYNGTTLTGYINGVSGGTATPSFNITQNNGIVGRVGFAASGYMLGYISNLRVVKGTAVYTSNFTPSTTPLTAITNTSLLLSYTNAGILDNAMMNDLETVGNAQISTSVKKYGTGSMYFDGTGDYLTAPPSQNFAFNTGNYTGEAWVYITSFSTSPVVFDTRTSGGSTVGVAVYFNTSGNAIAFINASNAITSASTYSTNTWYHIALVRSGSTNTLYVNGTSVGTYTFGTSLTDNWLTVGAANDARDTSSTLKMSGYIDDLRITKGYARYTANFTAPTAAFADKG